MIYRFVKNGRYYCKEFRIMNGMMEVKLEDISHDFAAHFITSVAALAKFLLRGTSVFPCLGGSRTP